MQTKKVQPHGDGTMVCRRCEGGNDVTAECERTKQVQSHEEVTMACRHCDCGNDIATECESVSVSAEF